MTGQYEIGFIGAGNMAEGIVSAMLQKKLYKPGEMVIFDIDAGRRRYFADQFKTAVAEDNRQLVDRARRVVLAVKPQQFGELAAGLQDVVRADQLLVSILAGMSTRRIEAAFPRIKARVVRVMPNLPIRVGAGVAGLCAGKHATDQDINDVRAIFDAGGSTVIIPDESLMDAVTAVSGSGPAYFYYFVESMVAGGVACGLSETDALKLAENTCLGAARMMLETKEPPAELRRKVTSKGGTTQAALEHMNKVGVGEGIRDAVRAAFQRGRELGS